MVWRGISSNLPKGVDAVAKDKKKKKSGAKKQSKAKSRIKKLAGNPLVADVVAAALVATAAALRDPKRARALASDAGDELAELSKAGAQRGSALWEMALQIGRQSLDAVIGGDAPKTAKAAKPSKAAKPAKAARAARAAKPRARARKSGKKKQPAPVSRG